MRALFPTCATLMALAPISANAQPKVLVIVAGDPEASLVDQAQRVEAILSARPEVSLPVDSGLRRALHGEPAPAEPDGLERARAERRRLGWDEAQDTHALVRLGQAAGAAVAAVIRRTEDGATMQMFNVEARAFYERTLPLDSASDAVIGDYVVRRALAPIPTDDASAAEATDPATSLPRPAATVTPLAPTHDDPPQDEEPSWMGRNWPYFVAGALLVGAISFVVVTRRDDASLSPVLRFRPGGP